MGTDDRAIGPQRGKGPLTIPKVEDRCIWCQDPVGFHNGIKAMNCLTEMAQAGLWDLLEALGMEAIHPHDPAFEHDVYFGCVPKDFSQRTGRSKTHYQTKFDDPTGPDGWRYRWNGGCDALTTRREATNAI